MRPFGVWQDEATFRAVLPAVPLPVFVPSKKKIAANDAEAKKLAEVRGRLQWWRRRFCAHGDATCGVLTFPCAVTAVSAQEEAKLAVMGDLDVAIAELAASIPPRTAFGGAWAAPALVLCVAWGSPAVGCWRWCVVTLP